MAIQGKREDGGLSQAIAQFHSIVEMVSRLRRADNADDERERDDARQAINDDALSVEVRSAWAQPDEARRGEMAMAEYKILLCTGGPAVQIVGELDEWNEPETARIQHQDWFTPWTDWRPANSDNVEKILLAYAQTFYFGR